jgi:hypothetical protein
MIRTDAKIQRLRHQQILPYFHRHKSVAIAKIDRRIDPQHKAMFQQCLGNYDRFPAISEQICDELGISKKGKWAEFDKRTILFIFILRFNCQTAEIIDDQLERQVAKTLILLD